MTTGSNSLKGHPLKKHSRGFSLIELLIVVALIGILSAVAFPSYSNYVTKTRRTDATLTLLNAAQTMERCKATAFSYESCTLPTESPEGYYKLSVTSTASSFTLKATAQSLQADDSDCSEITYTDLGQKLPAACWPE